MHTNLKRAHALDILLPSMAAEHVLHLGRPRAEQLPPQQRRARGRDRAVQLHALTRHDERKVRRAGHLRGPAAHATRALVVCWAPSWASRCFDRARSLTRLTQGLPGGIYSRPTCRAQRRRATTTGPHTGAPRAVPLPAHARRLSLTHARLPPRVVRPLPQRLRSAPAPGTLLAGGAPELRRGGPGAAVGRRERAQRGGERRERRRALLELAQQRADGRRQRGIVAAVAVERELVAHRACLQQQPRDLLLACHRMVQRV